MCTKRNLRNWLGILAFFSAMSISLPGYAFFIDHTENFDFSAMTPGHELGCLALNIYHEGRGENLEGQAAIAAVTLNRVESQKYPDTVCGVVWQRKQFSWTHVASRHHSVIDQHAWRQALILAELFIDGAAIASVGEATHYHSTSVEPYWMAEKKLIARVGNHYFYVL